MEEREATLVNFDLHLMDGHNIAALSLGITAFPMQQDHPAQVEVIRMFLTIDSVRTMHEVFGQLLQRVPPGHLPAAQSMN